MGFFFAAFAFMVFGRKLGWFLSRTALYPAPTVIAIVLCIVWGVAVAYSIHALIAWLTPGPILKWVMGYAMGAYVAIPNYGLFVESSIPMEDARRHSAVTHVPLAFYVIFSISLAIAIN